MEEKSTTKYFFIIFSAIILFILLTSTIMFFSKRGLNTDVGIGILVPSWWSLNEISTRIWTGIIILNLIVIILSAIHYRSHLQEINYTKSLKIPLIYLPISFLLGFLPLALRVFGLFPSPRGEEIFGIILAPLVAIMGGVITLGISAIINGIIFVVTKNLKNRR